MPTGTKIDASGRGSRGLIPSDMDVICNLKRYASDESPCQRPVLVLPECFRGRLRTPLPGEKRPLHPLSLERRRNWADLASVLLENRKRHRTVRYLIRAAQGGSVAEGDLFPLPWHLESHENNLVYLENTPVNTYLTLFPVARFKATLKRE